MNRLLKIGFSFLLLNSFNLFPSIQRNTYPIYAGNYHSLAIKQDGTVVAWGSNWSKQCDIPEEVKNATEIAAGDDFSVAIVNGKSIVCGKIRFIP